METNSIFETLSKVLFSTVASTRGTVSSFIRAVLTTEISGSSAVFLVQTSFPNSNVALNGTLSPAVKLPSNMANVLLRGIKVVPLLSVMSEPSLS